MPFHEPYFVKSARFGDDGIMSAVESSLRVYPTADEEEAVSHHQPHRSIYLPRRLTFEQTMDGMNQNSRRRNIYPEPAAHGYDAQGRLTGYYHGDEEVPQSPELEGELHVPSTAEARDRQSRVDDAGPAQQSQLLQAQAASQTKKSLKRQRGSDSVQNSRNISTDATDFGPDGQRRGNGHDSDNVHAQQPQAFEATVSSTTDETMPHHKRARTSSQNTGMSDAQSSNLSRSVFKAPVARMTMAPPPITDNINANIDLASFQGDDLPNNDPNDGYIYSRTNSFNAAGNRPGDTEPEQQLSDSDRIAAYTNNNYHSAGDQFVFNFSHFNGTINNRPVQCFGQQQQQPAYPPDPAGAPPPQQQYGAYGFNQPNENVYTSHHMDNQVQYPHYAQNYPTQTSDTKTQAATQTTGKAPTPTATSSPRPQLGLRANTPLPPSLQPLIAAIAALPHVSVSIRHPSRAILKKPFDRTTTYSQATPAQQVIRDHFQSGSGILRDYSELRDWYGDSSVFTDEVWGFLVGGKKRDGASGKRKRHADGEEGGEVKRGRRDEAGDDAS